jgi:predicted HTH domain antitoxin
MEGLDVFTVNELSQRMADLLEDAQHGRLVLITNQDRPTFLAVPFDDRLLEHGLNRAIALHLFENGLLTLAQASQLAMLSLEEFIELLGEVGIPAVDYPPEELNEEVEHAL